VWLYPILFTLFSNFH